MGSFFRVDTSKLMRGAARLLYASSDSDTPTAIADVIDTASGAGQFDPVDAGGAEGWLDLGATRQGCQISVNNTETAFDIDQVQGAVGTAPDTWECFVDTRIAEMTLEHLVFAWEGVEIATNVSPSPQERQTAFAGATTYTERKLAIAFRKPSGKLMLYSFHRAVRAPQQGTIDMQKGGTEMDIQVRFNILADGSVVDPRGQFFDVFEQV